MPRIRTTQRLDESGKNHVIEALVERVDLLERVDRILNRLKARVFRRIGIDLSQRMIAAVAAAIHTDPTGRLRSLSTRNGLCASERRLRFSRDLNYPLWRDGVAKGERDDVDPKMLQDGPVCGLSLETLAGQLPHEAVQLTKPARVLGTADTRGVLPAWRSSFWSRYF